MGDKITMRVNKSVILDGWWRGGEIKVVKADSSRFEGGRLLQLEESKRRVVRNDRAGLVAAIETFPFTRWHKISILKLPCKHDRNKVKRHILPTRKRGFMDMREAGSHSGQKTAICGQLSTFPHWIISRTADRYAPRHRFPGSDPLWDMCIKWGKESITCHVHRRMTGIPLWEPCLSFLQGVVVRYQPDQAFWMRSWSFLVDPLEWGIEFQLQHRAPFRF
jgi:hypothetical protein